MEESASFSNVRLLELLRAGLPEGSSLKFEVAGWSMFPSIRDGDTVIVSSLSAGSTVCLGAVVVFAHPSTGQLLIHRVVGRQGRKYLVKGDTLFRPDGFVSGQDILGIVTKVLRHDGKEVLIPGLSRLLSVVLSRSRFFSSVLFLWKCLPLRFRVALKKRLFSV